MYISPDVCVNRADGVTRRSKDSRDRVDEQRLETVENGERERGRENCIAFFLFFYVYVSQLHTSGSR